VRGGEEGRLVRSPFRVGSSRFAPARLFLSLTLAALGALGRRDGRLLAGLAGDGLLRGGGLLLEDGVDAEGHGDAGHF